MAGYKVENTYIKHGLVDNAEDKIEETVQPVLDAGTAKGWTLHSFQATAAAKGTNLVFVWQLPD
ncbi:hypothetical protein [Myceligenerans pegani]|uniref:DUF4177 domain-containing protein n=1 Tax=Myceligenerans pegani TaxID=2776917 RepID=A0ABR9N196_9MICO|nr:hypothetical protein [Myceligenerans sp. TRM 65318]MBE1877426.1 hypothetical protein [Myceligenerans sp. TRM 65318]MBE3019697.1 hypothetical protein [Myceligenerans sp. TRM 65318]